MRLLLAIILGCAWGFLVQVEGVRALSSVGSFLILMIPPVMIGVISAFGGEA